MADGRCSFRFRWCEGQYLYFINSRCWCECVCVRACVCGLVGEASRIAYESDTFFPVGRFVDIEIWLGSFPFSMPVLSFHFGFFVLFCFFRLIIYGKSISAHPTPAHNLESAVYTYRNRIQDVLTTRPSPLALAVAEPSPRPSSTQSKCI